MADLVEITTGTDLDNGGAGSPVLALAAAPAEPVVGAATGSLSLFDQAKSLFGGAAGSVSSAASSVNARAAAATGGNAGLMWIILAAMVAVGLYLFSAKGKGSSSKGSFLKSTFRGRKPSGGTFAL